MMGLKMFADSNKDGILSLDELLHAKQLVQDAMVLGHVSNKAGEVLDMVENLQLYSGAYVGDVQTAAWDFVSQYQLPVGMPQLDRDYIHGITNDMISLIDMDQDSILEAEEIKDALDFLKDTLIDQHRSVKRTEKADCKTGAIGNGCHQQAKMKFRHAREDTRERVNAIKRSLF